jgi:hypothetical protein
VCLSQSHRKNKVLRTFYAEDYVRSCNEVDLRVDSKINCLISLKEVLDFHRPPTIARSVTSVVTLFQSCSSVLGFKNFRR